MRTKKLLAIVAVTIAAAALTTACKSADAAHTVNGVT